MELFKSMARIDIVHVPHKGVPAGIIDLVAGNTQTGFASWTSAGSHVKSGRLRALGVGSLEPSALYPGLPTIATTLPGFESLSMMTLMGPAKMPEAIVNRLNQETVRFLRTPEAKERFLVSGLEVVGNTPAEFAAAMKADITRLTKVIRDASIKAD
jgi:tripartite-type tricarboxylate transporter receptor subunit TctC